MSRAGQLLHRLEVMSLPPQVNEQTPEEENSDDHVSSANDQSDDENIDPTMDDPMSPFSRVTHNPDGSMKVDSDDHQMNDKGRFVVRKKR